MSVTPTVKPTYPLAGTAFKVNCYATRGNYVKFFLTACPPEAAEWYKKLHDGAIGKFEVARGDVARDIDLTLPSPGSYVFELQELAKGASSFGGGYEDDPAGFNTETVLESTTGATIVAGQKLTAEIGAQELGTATLTMWLWV